MSNINLTLLFPHTDEKEILTNMLFATYFMWEVSKEAHEYWMEESGVPSSLLLGYLKKSDELYQQGSSIDEIRAAFPEVPSDAHVLPQNTYDCERGQKAGIHYLNLFPIIQKDTVGMYDADPTCSISISEEENSIWEGSLEEFNKEVPEGSIARTLVETKTKYPDRCFVSVIYWHFFTKSLSGNLYLSGDKVFDIQRLRIRDEANSLDLGDEFGGLNLKSIRYLNSEEVEKPISSRIAFGHGDYDTVDLWEGLPVKYDFEDIPILTRELQQADPEAICSALRTASEGTLGDLLQGLQLSEMPNEDYELRNHLQELGFRYNDLIYVGVLSCFAKHQVPWVQEIKDVYEVSFLLHRFSSDVLQFITDSFNQLPSLESISFVHNYGRGSFPMYFFPKEFTKLNVSSLDFTEATKAYLQGEGEPLRIEGLFSLPSDAFHVPDPKGEETCGLLSQMSNLEYLGLTDGFFGIPNNFHTIQSLKNLSIYSNTDLVGFENLMTAFRSLPNLETCWIKAEPLRPKVEREKLEAEFPHIAFTYPEEYE